MKTLAATLSLFALALLANAGTVTNATSTTTNAPALPPVDPQREYQTGLALLQENNFALAADCFERATKARPDFAEAYTQWGIALQRLGQISASAEVRFKRYCEAAERFQKAATLQPQNRPVYFLWGEMLVQIGDLPVTPQTRLACYQGASERYRKAAELAPGEWDAYSKWADILGSKLPPFASNARSQVLLQRDAATLYSNAVARATYTADIAILCANWGAALVRAAKAETDPTPKEALLRQALDKFERSARTVSNNANTYTMWGSALVQVAKLTRLRSDFRDAIDKFNISLSLKPKDPTTLYALACAQSLMNSPILAIETLKQCFAAETDGAYRQLALRDPDFDDLRSERGFKEIYEVKTPTGMPVFNPPLRNAPLRSQ